MSNIFHSEVVELHEFLNDWLKGMAPKGGGRPERLIKALAEDFIVIHPDGSRDGKANVVESFASAYGKKPAEYALQLANIESRIIGKDIGIVTYEESHRGESERARVSAGVLRRRMEDSGIEWLFLIETPVPNSKMSSTPQEIQLARI